MDEITLIRDTINHYGPEFIAPLSIQICRAGVQKKNSAVCWSCNRRSLMLLLALAKQRGAAPAITDVRWMLYAGYDAANHPLHLNGDGLEAQRWRWWVYQANDLLHICYEALLKFSLDVLGEYPAGISLSRLVGETAGRLLSAHDGKTPTWESFLAAHPAPANCLDPHEQTGEFHLQRELMRKMRLDGVCEPADAWLAIKLLAVLHNRVRSSSRDPSEELGKLDASLVRSLVTERRYLDAHAEDDFSSFIARLIEERVIRRHLWVGLRKFRAQGDYTFLIETDDGRVRRRAVDGPVFTNPRLGPAITFLRDVRGRRQRSNRTRTEAAECVMKFYDRFGAKGFHSSFITTFGIDFDTFENVCLSRLRGAGCTNNFILPDARMQTYALDGASVLPRYAGRFYSALGMAAPRGGVFHSKLYLRIGRRAGELLIGSASMTAPGLAGNREVMGMMECGPEDSGEQRIIAAAWSYLEPRLDQTQNSVAHQLGWMRARSSWLLDTEPASGLTALGDGSGAAFLTNGGEA